MEARIEKAIDIFLDALNEGTLEAGDCTCCAVGNLVRVGMGWTVVEYDDKYFTGSNWSELFHTDDSRQCINKNPERLMRDFPIIKEQITSTGFTWQELAKIEYAFETNYRRRGWQKRTKYKNQVRALAAVIEVMKSFKPEENEDLDIQAAFTDKVGVLR